MIKKIYNYLFVFCLTIAICLGFNTSNSKAAILPPEVSNSVEYSRIEYDNKISEYSLFNSFDYSFLDEILVDVHLTSSNMIETDIQPTTTQTTTYTGNCFGSLCYQQQVKLLILTMYSVTSGGTTKIYYFSNNETDGKILNYSTTTCNTVSYVNNTISTTTRTLYLVYTDSAKYQNAVLTLYNAYENNEDLMLGSGSNLANAITSMERNWGKLLYYNNTGLNNVATTKTSTCNTSSTTQYTCNESLNQTYSFMFYNQNLGTINFNKSTFYNFNKCYISSIGTNVDNGYYKSYTIDFNNLTLNNKRKIWQKLTQINETSDFEYNTLIINKISSNGHIISGIDIDFRLELKFKGNANYQYNNAYFKFNTNSTATLNNFYYGIFDLYLNWNTNNTYTVALLNENSIINSDNLILISSIDDQLNFINFDYNFNIALVSDVLIDQILSVYEYEECKWYQFMCHVGNFFIKLVYDVPLLQPFYTIFNNVSATITSFIDLFIEYKEITFIGSVAILSLIYHLIKRITE